MRTTLSAKRVVISLLFFATALSALSIQTNSTQATTAVTDTATASTTELLMVEEAGCVYCAKFNREISVAYPKTTEGKTAPLRRLDLHSEWPASLTHIETPRYTPTFILIHNNNEVGRLVGYNGDEYFWFLLGELLDKIEHSPQSASTTEQSG